MPIADMQIGTVYCLNLHLTWHQIGGTSAKHTVTHADIKKKKMTFGLIHDFHLALHAYVQQG